MSVAPTRRGRSVTPANLYLDGRIVEIVNSFGRITVRGVFYQCVKHELVEKTEGQCRKVGERLLALRRNGRVPYASIVDETRIIYGGKRYRGLAGLSEAAHRLYRQDYWMNSEVNVQVWVEKRGLAGLLMPLVCDKWGLDLYVAAGQMSETYLFTAGSEIDDDGRDTYVYALTDFDPGGKTIYNTLKDGSKKAPGGLRRFSRGVPVHVDQLALTQDQVVAWYLPTRPAKRSDSRAPKFIAEHGDVSVELDAIDPPKVLEIVDSAISNHMDPAELERWKLEERLRQETLRDVLLTLG